MALAKGKQVVSVDYLETLLRMALDSKMEGAGTDATILWRDGKTQGKNGDYQEPYVTIRLGATDLTISNGSGSVETPGGERISIGLSQFSKHDGSRIDEIVNNIAEYVISHSNAVEEERLSSEKNDYLDNIQEFILRLLDNEHIAYGAVDYIRSLK